MVVCLGVSNMGKNEAGLGEYKIVERKGDIMQGNQG